MLGDEKDFVDEPVAASKPDSTRGETGHESHCFVAMPSGRDVVEQKWYKGWYEVVVKPAIVAAGFEPILSAAELQPGAINDEIRTHLALDPMAIVDLGGTDPEDEPNPNVMYELGIRHALGLPLVMMGWKGQRLPFDVGNQRVIIEDRDLLDLEANRQKLIAFIRAAAEGRYYKPMEAVARHATIEAASRELGEDSVLRALANEVRDLRLSLGTTGQRAVTVTKGRPTIKHILQSTKYRKELFATYSLAGGTAASWGQLLRTPLDPNEVERFRKWSKSQWESFVESRAPVGAVYEEGEEPEPAVEISPRVAPWLLDRVRNALPSQPWPTGIHKALAEQFEVPPKDVSACIQELIERGEVFDQVDGKILDATGD